MSIFNMEIATWVYDLLV